MSDETCWTMIEAAAAGEDQARDLFAHAYHDVIRAALSARWRGTPLTGRVEDALQDVFMDCFRARGALNRADREHGRGFRAFLGGIVRNVALRYEERAGRERREEAHSDFEPTQLPNADDALSVAFDRAWAKNLLARAVQRMARQAEAQGPEAKVRVRILRMRFADGLPIRDIAARLEQDPAHTHRAFARARDEFKRALTEEVAYHHPDGSTPAIERECEHLLTLLRAR